MVRNKGELLQATNAWVDCAKKDLSQKLTEFMHRANANVAKIASILDVDVATVEGMLNGTLDVPMSLFAKILISTGHVIVITPEDQIPQCGNMRNVAPQHPQPVAPRRPMPARDAKGRFVRTSQRLQMPMPEDMPSFGGMMPPMLENFNGGYPMPSPNGMLPPIEEMMPQMENPFMGEEHETPMVEVPRTQCAENSDDEAVNALVDAIRANPQLANLFGSVMDKLG